jgi:hypothetical protein
MSMSKTALSMALAMLLISVGSAAAFPTDGTDVLPARGEQPEDIQAPRGERPEDIQAPRGEQPDEIQAPRGEQPEDIQSLRGADVRH